MCSSMKDTLVMVLKFKGMRMLLFLAVFIECTKIGTAECPTVDNKDEFMFEVNSMCYHYIENPDIQVTFDIAEPDCKSRGGHLLTIKDNATQGELVRQITNVGDVHTILIGLKREGVWKWVTGEELLYNNWKNVDICNNCNCAKMKLREGGVWEAVTCESQDWFTAYVCQYAPVDGSNSAFNVHPVKWSLLSVLSTVTATVVLMLCH